MGTLVAELWMVIKMASAVTSLEDSRESIEENPDEALSYDNLEKNVAVRFNDFYFGAVDGCYGRPTDVILSYRISFPDLSPIPAADVKYDWFWTWLANHCVDGIGSDRCRSCGDFSATTCLADLETCYLSEDEAGPTCPYEICRHNTLTFIIRSFRYVASMHASLRTS